MANDVADPEGPLISPPAEEPPRHRSRRWLVAVGVAVVLVVAGIFVVASIVDMSRVPEFPSLAARPDPSLAGTVAYLDWSRPACVRVVDAAGGPTKVLGCDGNYLEWLDDGRLLVLRYDQPAGPETQTPTGGTILDVAAGTNEQVPLEDIPPRMPEGPDPAVGPNGERITVVGRDGEVEVLLDDGSGTRRLLSAQGGSAYEMGVQAWSPDGEWVLLSDSAARLLLVTTDEPSETRVLAEGFGNGVAVTGEDAFTG